MRGPAIFRSGRERLIRELRAHGILDERVLAVMADVPRDRFVTPASQAAAWEDRALPIAAGQTISQPYMVALMTQELQLSGKEHVLEVGTGSGYQSAILSRLCRSVVSIERIPELSDPARDVLDELGCRNVETVIGDGSLGYPSRMPYDRIIATAGAPSVPPPLYDQLTLGGWLVIPVGEGHTLMLQRVTRTPDGPVTVDVCPCSFVPLIGAAAWADDNDEGE